MADLNLSRGVNVGVAGVGVGVGSVTNQLIVKQTTLLAFFKQKSAIIKFKSTAMKLNPQVSICPYSNLFPPYRFRHPERAPAHLSTLTGRFRAPRPIDRLARRREQPQRFNLLKFNSKTRNRKDTSVRIDEGAPQPRLRPPVPQASRPTRSSTRLQSMHEGSDAPSVATRQGSGPIAVKRRAKVEAKAAEVALKPLSSAPQQTLASLNGGQMMGQPTRPKRGPVLSEKDKNVSYLARQAAIAQANGPKKPKQSAGDSSDLLRRPRPAQENKNPQSMVSKRAKRPMVKAMTEIVGDTSFPLNEVARSTFENSNQQSCPAKKAPRSNEESKGSSESSKSQLRKAKPCDITFELLDTSTVRDDTSSYHAIPLQNCTSIVAALSDLKITGNNPSDQLAPNQTEIASEGQSNQPMLALRPAQEPTQNQIERFVWSDRKSRAVDEPKSEHALPSESPSAAEERAVKAELQEITKNTSRVLDFDQSSELASMGGYHVLLNALELNESQDLDAEAEAEAEAEGPQERGAAHDEYMGECSRTLTDKEENHSHEGSLAQRHTRAGAQDEYNQEDAEVRSEESYDDDYDSEEESVEAGDNHNQTPVEDQPQAVSPLTSRLDDQTPVPHSMAQGAASGLDIEKTQEYIKKEQESKPQVYTRGPRKYQSGKCKGHWTKEEDAVLTTAVDKFGGRFWKKIAQMLNGRTDVQCLHRWQKVLNPSLVKGPWNKMEDKLILGVVLENGATKWSTIAKNMPNRIGKQCRERWHNHLNPLIKKGEWSNAEELALFVMQKLKENQWADCARHLEGRTDNTIKNHWNSSMKKKVSNLEQYVESQFEYFCSHVIKLPHQGRDQEKWAFKKLYETFQKELLAEQTKLVKAQYIDYIKNKAQALLKEHDPEGNNEKSAKYLIKHLNLRVEDFMPAPETDLGNPSASTHHGADTTARRGRRARVDTSTRGEVRPFTVSAFQDTTTAAEQQARHTDHRVRPFDPQIGEPLETSPLEEAAEAQRPKKKKGRPPKMRPTQPVPQQRRVQPRNDDLEEEKHPQPNHSHLRPKQMSPVTPESNRLLFEVLESEPQAQAQPEKHETQREYSIQKNVAFNMQSSSERLSAQHFFICKTQPVSRFDLNGNQFYEVQSGGLRDQPGFSQPAMHPLVGLDGHAMSQLAAHLPHGPQQHQQAYMPDAPSLQSYLALCGALHPSHHQQILQEQAHAANNGNLFALPSQLQGNLLQLPNLPNHLQERRPHVPSQSSNSLMNAVLGGIQPFPQSRKPNSDHKTKSPTPNLSAPGGSPEDLSVLSKMKTPDTAENMKNKSPDFYHCVNTIKKSCRSDPNDKTPVRGGEANPIEVTPKQSLQHSEGQKARAQGSVGSAFRNRKQMASPFEPQSIQTVPPLQVMLPNLSDIMPSINPQLKPHFSGVNKQATSVSNYSNFLRGAVGQQQTNLHPTAQQLNLEGEWSQSDVFAQQLMLDSKHQSFAPDASALGGRFAKKMPQAVNHHLAAGSQLPGSTLKPVTGEDFTQNITKLAIGIAKSVSQCPPPNGTVLHPHQSKFLNRLRTGKMMFDLPANLSQYNSPPVSDHSVKAFNIVENTERVVKKRSNQICNFIKSASSHKSDSYSPTKLD